MKLLDNFFTSGLKIDDDYKDMKSKYQMLNIALILSFFGLIFGIVSNFFKDDYSLIYVEIFLALANIVMFFVPRTDIKHFSKIATILTTQFTALFLYLMYSSEPYAMKHVWLFTYPIIILYYENIKKAMLWLFFLYIMIFLAPMQPFVEVLYSLHQTMYILFVVIIISLIMYFYRTKIDEAKALILKQKHELLDET